MHNGPASMPNTYITTGAKGCTEFKRLVDVTSIYASSTLKR